MTNKYLLDLATTLIQLIKDANKNEQKEAAARYWIEDILPAVIEIDIATQNNDTKKVNRLSQSLNRKLDYAPLSENEESIRKTLNSIYVETI
ncbi:hypothetical protein QWY82_11330 [Simiduia curdlanivorans]|uniref:Uncharacterized protein n=1 Tax=Simiduia curdlanivorans TaxID=1492769 RepID=A0ABV8VAK5_9GAMM|nr:hypothetical protein [Simiduia curdlanivorans]MDN3639397.1 hypothetical protein [Simiduia curdlanivorans]